MHISYLLIASGIMNELHSTHSLSTISSKVFPEAQHFVSKDNVRFDFSSSHPPVVKIDPGDLVHVETNDCFNGQIQPDTLSSWENHRSATARGKTESSGGTYVDGSMLDELPRSQRNPVTGPIYVNSARPGDILAVTLVDIRPKGIGVACCGSWGGQISSWMNRNSATLRFFDMSECGNIVTMRETEVEVSNVRRGSMPPRKNRLGPIKFPASPMLGVIGVAPSSREQDPIETMPAGKHGGNLDNNANGIGSTIYIPINRPGGLLSIGDMHASQGDGEISGSGVEIGGDVLLQCRVLRHEDLYGYSYDSKVVSEENYEPDGEKDVSTTENRGYPWKIEYPVTETSTHWITHGVVVCDIPKTTSIACQEAAKLLVGQWGFSPEEAFIFLSVKGNLGLCQACHPDKGTQIAKMSVPRLDDLCPRAFKTLLSSVSNQTPVERKNAE